MVGSLANAVLALALALAAAGAVLAALNRRPGKPLLQGLLVLQLLLLGQAGVAVARLLSGERPVEQAVFIGYLVVSVLLVPGGLVWSFEEKSRYGTLILGAACLVVAVLQVRLLSLWSVLG